LLSINTAWLNAHGGVLPGYRGLDSNLWAVSEDRFDLVGYSIHKIVPQIDAGEILITNRVEITSLIDLLTVRLKIANKLSQDLVTFVCGEVSFRNLDFMPNTNEDSEYRSHIMFLPLLRCVIKAFRKGL
jgi:methionyl-tRNA formyltransferase